MSLAMRHLGASADAFPDAAKASKTIAATVATARIAAAASGRPVPRLAGPAALAAEARA